MRMLNNNVVLAEEQILVSKVLSEEVGTGAMAGAPTNNTAGVEVKQPKIDKKNIKKYQVMNRRAAPVEC